MTLPGRSLMLVRNVGLHMFTDAVTDHERGCGDYRRAFSRLSRDPRPQRARQHHRERGGIIVCEEGDEIGVPQRLMGLTKRGELFELGQKQRRARRVKEGFVGDFRFQEWAGACFNPCGRWLFVNIQTPGMTFAFTGPWDNGAL